MSLLEVSSDHIIHQIKARYPRADPNTVLERITGALRKDAPDDWCFTKSPTARFFVVDYETGIKFLGLSYRDSNRDLTEEIREKAADLDRMLREIDAFTRRYIDGVRECGSSIRHELRTAYPKTKGEIGEKKRIFSRIREELSHVIPVDSRKVAARPNAIVMPDGTSWARQSLSWIDPRNQDREFHLFARLTARGLDRCKLKVFSFNTNGDVRDMTGRSDPSYASHCPASLKECIAPEEKSLLGSSAPGGFRSISFWTLPTYLDRRLIDLDFKERCSDKEEGPGLRNEDLAELFILKKIVARAKITFRYEQG